MYLEEIIANLFPSQNNFTNIANDYSISSSLMTHLSKKFQNVLDRQHRL